MPRLPRAAVNKILETQEQEIGQAEPRIIQSTGSVKESAAPGKIQVVDLPVDEEWAANVAFSRTKITIVVNESTDKNAEDPVFCGNNGEMPITENGRPGWLYRGKEYTIERRFVESLTRAKVTTYTQKDEEAPDGTRHKRMVPHTALKYPFRVINDTHPQGAHWLKSILLEQA